MENRILKTQKEYIHYLRMKRRIGRMISAISVLLLFLYIVLMNVNLPDPN